MRLGRSRKAVVVAEGEAATAVAEDEEGTAAVVVAIAVDAAVDRVGAADAIVSQTRSGSEKAQLARIFCYFATKPDSRMRRSKLGRIRNTEIKPRRFAS